MREPELEIEFAPEPIRPEPVKAKPVPEAASPSQEIDLSNEWEDMIEIEPAESTPPSLELQTFHEVQHEPSARDTRQEPAAAAKSTSPERSSSDQSSQIADKIQEIQFYITQEMWEPAKAAILDLTEIAPDAPEVTELISAVSAGQAKSKLPTVASADAMPAMMEETPAAFSPTEIERSNQR